MTDIPMTTKIRRIVTPSAAAIPSISSPIAGRHHIGHESWNNGPSSDIMDMIWSFISPNEQSHVITSVCHRWNTLNKNGYGWFGSENEPFQLDKWFERSGSPTIWCRLLSNRWQHIRSLHIPSIPVIAAHTLVNPRLLVNLTHLHCECVGDHRYLMAAIVKLPNLQSLSLSNIKGTRFSVDSGLPVTPNNNSNNGFSSLPSLTCLELSSAYYYEYILIDLRGGWHHKICQLILSKGAFSFSPFDGTTIQHNRLASALPSLTSLSLYDTGMGVIESLLLAMHSIPLLTSLSITNLEIESLPKLVPNLSHIKRLELNNLSLYSPVRRWDDISGLLSLMPLVSPTPMSIIVYFHAYYNMGGIDPNESIGDHHYSSYY
jgi:hypothetical protein